MISVLTFLLGLAIGLLIAPQSVGRERARLVQEKLKERKKKPVIIDFEDERKLREVEQMLGVYEEEDQEEI
jgi:hypothetical protein